MSDDDFCLASPAGDSEGGEGDGIMFASDDDGDHAVAVAGGQPGRPPVQHATHGVLACWVSEERRFCDSGALELAITGLCRVAWTFAPTSAGPLGGGGVDGAVVGDGPGAGNVWGTVTYAIEEGFPIEPIAVSHIDAKSPAAGLLIEGLAKDSRNKRDGRTIGEVLQSLAAPVTEVSSTGDLKEAISHPVALGLRVDRRKWFCSTPSAAAVSSWRRSCCGPPPKRKREATETTAQQQGEAVLLQIPPDRRRRTPEANGDRPKPRQRESLDPVKMLLALNLVRMCRQTADLSNVVHAADEYQAGDVLDEDPARKKDHGKSTLQRAMAKADCLGMLLDRRRFAMWKATAAIVAIQVFSDASPVTGEEL